MAIRQALFVLSALALVFFGSSASSHDGLPLFRKMQDALGGADRIAAIRDFEQEVRAESWNGNTGQSIGEVRKKDATSAVNNGLKLADLAAKPLDLKPVLSSR